MYTLNTRVVTLAAAAALACETIVNSEYNIYIIFFFAPLTILLSRPRPPLVILSSCVLFLFTVDFLIPLHVRARALIILFAQTQCIIRIALALETYMLRIDKKIYTVVGYIPTYLASTVRTSMFQCEA